MDRYASANLLQILRVLLRTWQKNKSWLAPMKKFRERVKMWTGQPMGLYWNTRIFNTFCLPVLTYVAQLEDPPQWVTLEVEALMRKLAPGPTGWASCSDLYLLHESFGLSASFTNLAWISKAAQVRVFLCDPGCRPSTDFLTRIKHLQNNINIPGDSASLGWHACDWYSKIFSLVIHRSYLAIVSEVGSMEVIRKARLVDPPLRCRDHTWNKQVQKTLYKYLAAQALMDPASRTREKYQYWDLAARPSAYALPGSVRQHTAHWQAAKAAWLLRQLQSLVPPRVHCSVLSTVWNRWTTARRFQSRGPCLLGCGECEGDDIAHYCSCAVTQELCKRRLRLDPSVYATLHAWLLVHPYIRTKEDLTSLSLLQYGIYTVTNGRRHQGISCESF